VFHHPQAAKFRLFTLEHGSNAHMKNHERWSALLIYVKVQATDQRESCPLDLTGLHSLPAINKDKK
jgi:hypothetical protein